MIFAGKLRNVKKSYVKYGSMGVWEYGNVTGRFKLSKDKNYNIKKLMMKFNSHTPILPYSHTCIL
jgi:hypothetical protein